MTRPRRRAPEGPSRPRAFNVEDALWEEAVAIAKARGDSLSAVLRDRLRKYVREHRDDLGGTP